LKLLPRSWPKTDEAMALGFLAQTAIELVHEESWENYKLQALSPLARLQETQAISQSVIKGILPQKALDPVVLEANLSFCGDPVLAHIVAEKNIDPTDITISKDDKAQDIFTQCGFLLQLCGSSYRRTAENLLVEECFGQRRRSEIDRILKNFLAELIQQGHSRMHIESKIRECFFQRAPTTVNRNTLRFFFRKFSAEHQDYLIFGKAETKLLEALSRLIPIEIIKGRRAPRKIKAIYPKAKSEAYFQIDFRAGDHHAAVQHAGVLLSIGEAMLMLFPGGELGQVPKKLCATRKGLSHYIESETRPAFSRRILSHSKNSAVRHMDRLRKLILARDRNTEDIVGSNFFTATMMAGLGDKSTAPEVKLLTLWAAFEALLPNVPEGATNRISHFLEYIVPAVTLSYARDCFIEFSRELQRLHGSEYTDFLDSLPIQETRLADKLAAVVISGSADQQKALCKILSANPLALYRLTELKKKFARPNDFERTLKEHRERVAWQVQRIYRERNTVMHNGETSPAMGRLLSNTYHYYLLAYANIETVAKSYGNLSIPQSLSAIRKLSQSDQAKLAKAKSKFKDNAIVAQSILKQVVSGHFHSSL
jgi:hypothetical protein